MKQPRPLRYYGQAARVVRPNETEEDAMAGDSATATGAMRAIWDFLNTRKRYWLVPIILAFIFLCTLYILAGRSEVMAPFTYDL